MRNIIEEKELKNINLGSALALNKILLSNYPHVKLVSYGIKGNGFYIDVDLGSEKMNSENLKLLNKKLIAQLHHFAKDFVLKSAPITSALDMFANNEYKKEYINSTFVDYVPILFSEEYFDIFDADNFEIFEKCFAKLTNISSVVWKNRNITRISGVAFENKEEMKKYENELEEVKMRDHRKLGKELEMFMLSDVSQGMPFWLPNGLIVYNELVNFWREIHKKNGYQEIKTPIILSEELWHKSGHWDHYKNNMYTTLVGNDSYALKPMNCPGCMLVYKNKQHSYKEFPIRLAELGQVHRHEASGALNGLFRVRTFTQDDAHIFCLPNQIESEITNIIELIKSTYKLFGFEYNVEISTRPEDSMGSDEDWNLAENSLKNALIKSGIPYKINEGDGAFYGPKIDFHIKDCLGRSWQCGTIQLDFQMPERFELEYIDENGERKRPVMLHRVILGSIERFIGVLLEHFKGAFPIWLSPTQVNIIPLTNDKKIINYARYIDNELLKDEIRTALDDRNEKLGLKLRQSFIKKIPINFIIGENEFNNETISYRLFSNQTTYTNPKDETIKLVRKMAKRQ